MDMLRWVLLLLLSMCFGRDDDGLSMAFIPTTTTTKFFSNHSPIYNNHGSSSLLAKQVPAQESSTEEQEVFGVPLETVGSPLLLLMISQFLLFIGVGAVIPSIPLYGKEIGLSSAANGIVISAPAVALLLFSKVGGNFADVARKPAMIIGMAIIAVSDIGTALANGLSTLILARLGLGLGRCVSESGERGMLADLASRVPELRGRFLSLQQAVIALGIAIGAPFGGIVVERYGPRAAFLCVSGAAIVALILYFFLPETQESAIERASSDNDTDEASNLIERILIAPTEGASGPPEGGDWGDLLALKEWKGLALCQSGASFGFAAKIASIPILATSVLPGGAAGAGALLSAAGLSGLIGAPVGGLLTDRISARAAVMLSGIWSATCLALIPVALGASFTDGSSTQSIELLGQTLEGNALAFTALVMAWSTGAAAQGPAITAYAQELAPDGAEATALALPRAAGDGTYIVAPFILGLAADNILEKPGIECAVAGAATLLGVVALFFLGRKDS
jgi:MFS family permease